MNVYAEILVGEARRRGIGVEVVDDEHGLFRLEHGGRTVTCRESLTELTSAIAFTLCDNKRLTHRFLKEAGLRVPRQERYSGDEEAARFMRACGSIVVKPVQGEQGRGITVDVTGPDELRAAIALARRHCGEVLLEEYVCGRDLRVIVIGHRFVAAIERRPAFVTGDGHRTVRRLVDDRNRDLQRTTGGESAMPVNEETTRVIRKAGYSWDEVLPAGRKLQVCRTANYHTGGTITDVTDAVSPPLRRVAEEASRALGIPVVGLDFLVSDFTGDEYVIIEANERPGLANHEPQPTAERFIDLLFPETANS